MHFAALASVPLLDLRPGELLAGQHGRDQERARRDAGGGRREDRLQQHRGDLRLRRRDADPRDHARRSPRPPTARPSSPPSG